MQNSAVLMCNVVIIILHVHKQPAYAVLMPCATPCATAYVYTMLQHGPFLYRPPACQMSIISNPALIPFTARTAEIELAVASIAGTRSGASERVFDSDNGVGFGMLSLVLLSEAALGTDSHFSAYIQALPPMDVLQKAGWLWPEDDQQQLLPLQMVNNAQALQSQIADEHATLSGMLPVVEALGGSTAAFTLDDWMWAQAVCRSRAFPARDPDSVHVALIPGVDNANHSADAAFGAFLDNDTGDFGLVAGPGMLPSGARAKGEVFYNYGKYLSNEDLLFYYGFVTPNHAADWVACTFNAVDGIGHSICRDLATYQVAIPPDSDAHARAPTPNACHLIVGAGLSGGGPRGIRSLSSQTSFRPGPTAKENDLFWDCFEEDSKPVTHSPMHSIVFLVHSRTLMGCTAPLHTHTQARYFCHFMLRCVPHSDDVMTCSKF